MKALPPIPRETIDRQVTASDPSLSAWVSANAGSGKTHVLSQRVIRLLLDGVDPSRILCLTYTRAAAANMANRVFETLSTWTALDDAALTCRIADMERQTPARLRLVRARQLFARALETPGGLKIQTIHAFCESVLQQFPLEANVAARFRLLDPLQEQALFATARRELLTGAMAAGHPDLASAFAAVLEQAGEVGLDGLLSAILADRDRLRIFIDHLDEDGGLRARLLAAFGFPPEVSAEDVAAALWPLPGFDTDYFRRFAAEAEATGSAIVLKSILPAGRAAFAEADPMRRMHLLLEAFLTAKGEPYSIERTFKRNLRARLPDLVDRYQEAAGRLIDARDRLALLRMLENTEAALTVAKWLIGRYEQLKEGRGFLDFNDLIARTVRLLSRRDAGAWVLYKLDKGIDHILIDEAQDTSPNQWRVVRRLTDDFFAGAGARGDAIRTVFAVGDEKQSIYSFQGAAPESFARTGNEMSEAVRSAAGRFESVRLTLSFRSTDDVLGAVDRVFAAPEVRRGLTFADETIEHTAIRAGVPGFVELWPSFGAESVADPDDWTTPIGHATAPSVRLAGMIAATVRGWLASGERLHGRVLGPGDVLVLVRKRGPFVAALASALKDFGIPVAGADRLRLNAHIAVRDLAALGRVLLQPEDDLSLAALLRSPVFGFSEEKLLDLAAERGRHSLFAALRAAARRDPTVGAVVERLDAWSVQAAFRSPFDFYAGILERDGVRARLVGRLGPETGDVIDEFLNFALAQEQTGLPGLEPFLATLQASAPEIKREMDQARGEVRIMTVHAAKGLEAPVVFLVDAGTAGVSNQHMPRLLPVEPGVFGTDGFLWRAPGSEPCAVSAAIERGIRDRADDEYRRLLYVGMTRAEDRLILCGFHGQRTPGEASWLSLARRALEAAPETQSVSHPLHPEPVLRFAVTRDRPPGETEAAAAAPPEPRPLPEGLRVPLPPSPGLPRPLSPSGANALLVEAAATEMATRGSPVLDPILEPGPALRRGTILHKLLQRLPDLAEGDRAAAAGRYLARAASEWPDDLRDAMASSVLAILGNADFAAAFAPGSRAEVSLMGTLEIGGRPRTIAGKIDRLSVSDRQIFVVDYKTGRSVPSGPEEAAPEHVAQLALYAALLAAIYPGRAVRAALLYTEAPRLVVLPPAMLDAALARLGRA